VTLALYSGARLDFSALLWGQIAITATQAMTHYSNDYFDLDADLANTTPTRWSGGSRVLPAGSLSPAISLMAAYVLMLIAFVATLVLALFMRPNILTLLLTALILAWEYSAPPLRLHSRGIGEAVVTLIVPGLTPLVGFYLQTGHLALLPVLAEFPLCCLQFAMLLTIEFPDAVGDAAVGKRTLVVRLGEQSTAWLHTAVLAMGYLSLPVLIALGLPSLAAIAIVLSAPIAAWQTWRVHRHALRPIDSRVWDSLAFWSVALLIGTALAEMVAFLLLVGGV
jgi:1,4-dihydroxy-2-naphthoate octaprenyltransferase